MDRHSKLAQRAQRSGADNAPNSVSWPMRGLLALALLVSPALQASELSAGAQFRKEIQPILKEYCYDCHGDGESKGKVAFDAFKSDSELVGKHDLWLAVMKNLRAGIMPPARKPRPSAEEI